MELGRVDRPQGEQPDKRRLCAHAPCTWTTRHPCSNPVKITEDGKQRTLRTVGDKWSYLQRVKFGANAQPYYVLLDNEGKPLNKSYSYNENIEKYVEFLQTGLDNYRK